MPAAIGLRAQKGGAIAVAVALEGGEPRVLFSTLLPTHTEGDRLSLEPYGVAYAMPRGADGKATPAAAAAVSEGRARQDRIAADTLRALIDRLDPAPTVAALLVNRAGWVTDLLDYSLGWPEHVPVAEGLAVREALRSAFRACGIASVELDEKSLIPLAADTLDLSPEEIEAQLKALGADAGKPWRKEQKLAALAAWVAASA